jgi:hypothetical protein
MSSHLHTPYALTHPQTLWQTHMLMRMMWTIGKEWSLSTQGVTRVQPAHSPLMILKLGPLAAFGPYPSPCICPAFHYWPANSGPVQGRSN